MWLDIYPPDGYVMHASDGENGTLTDLRSAPLPRWRDQCPFVRNTGATGVFYLLAATGTLSADTQP